MGDWRIRELARGANVQAYWCLTRLVLPIKCRALFGQFEPVAHFPNIPPTLPQQGCERHFPGAADLRFQKLQLLQLRRQLSIGFYWKTHLATQQVSLSARAQLERQMQIGEDVAQDHRSETALERSQIRPRRRLAERAGRNHLQ